MSKVIVGVVPGQPRVVVVEAAAFARNFDATLVCAHVDESRYVAGAYPEGAVLALLANPAPAELGPNTMDATLRAHLAETLDDEKVAWSTQALAGDPATELARLADQLDARMIVVGTRERGIRGTLHEFLSGSVAAHLAHRQHRPVVVIPLNPVGERGQLPWNTAE